MMLTSARWRGPRNYSRPGGRSCAARYVIPPAYARGTPTAPLPAPSDHRREVSRYRGNVRGHGLRAPLDSAAVGGLDDARASRAAPSGYVRPSRSEAGPPKLRTDVTSLAVDGARPPSPHAAGRGTGDVGASAPLRMALNISAKPCGSRAGMPRGTRHRRNVA